MDDMDLKKKTLQEIIDLMDQKDGDRLKAHPKLSAAVMMPEKKDSIEVVEGSPEEESKESPLEEKDEDADEVSPEMIQKLLEMMNGK